MQEELKRVRAESADKVSKALEKGKKSGEKAGMTKGKKEREIW